MSINDNDDNAKGSVNNVSIRVPKDVWNMIANKASVDKVYVATIRSPTHSSEIGIFRDKNEVYKLACNIIGNHYLGLNIQSGCPTRFTQIFNYMYNREQPPNSVMGIGPDEIAEYPKNYEELFKSIKQMGKTLNCKVYIQIDEKQVI